MFASNGDSDQLTNNLTWHHPLAATLVTTASSYTCAGATLCQKSKLREVKRLYTWQCELDWPQSWFGLAEGNKPDSVGLVGWLLVMEFRSSGFSGLVVSMLASGTRVRGFKPGRSRRIFSCEKNPQHAFLRKGSKAVCPMSQICGISKKPVIAWKLGHRQNLAVISRPISSLANRGLWRLRGVQRLWSWRKELRAVHRGPVASRPRCIGVTRTANQSTSTSTFRSLCLTLYLFMWRVWWATKG
jgi:hypothetical protein